MAATNTTRFSDQQYRNWLKDTLSLLYLKEALEDIVDIDAIQFHQGLQKALGVFGAAPSTCSSCTQNSIIKDFRRRKWWMTCSLCDQWLQQIVQNHANQPLPSLHRENTDPQLWPTNPYEVFKCYMPYGCQQDQSAVDGDVQSILKLIQNCLHFSTSGRIGRLDLVDKLLEIRKSLFHSGNFLVADPKLKADMQTMLDFLRGLKALSGVEQNAVDEAIDKILQLQANKIDLSLNRELELKALQQQQIALEKDLRTHRTTLTAVKSDMKSLQKEVKSATVKGAATDLAVKTIQTELGANSTKLTTVFSEVKSLQKDVRSATATELDVKTLTEKTKGLELRMQKLQAVQDKFARFLQANDLEQYLGKLSHIMEQHGQRIQTLEEQAQTQSSQLQAQRSEIESCKRTLCDHEEELKTKRMKKSDIPDGLSTLDPKWTELYLQALREGKEKQRNVRLMIVGHEGVGKTTLARNLTNKPVQGVETTNGIEVHVRVGLVEVDGTWKESETGSKDAEVSERIARIIEPAKKNDKIAETDNIPKEIIPPEVIYSRTSYPSSADAIIEASTLIIENEAIEEFSQDSEKALDTNIPTQPSIKHEVMKKDLSITGQTMVKQLMMVNENQHNTDPDIIVSIWDFGGQFIFYATHQIFHSSGATYLLVLDLSKGFDDMIEDGCPVNCNRTKGKTVQDFIKFWMHSIHTFASLETGEPPVILVGTHRDKIDELEMSKEDYAKKYFENIRKLFDKTPLLHHIQPQQFFLDNLGPEKNAFDELRSSIIATAAEQSSFNKEIPAKWIPLEQALSQIKDKPYITFSEVCEIDSKSDVPIADVEMIRLFLMHHHFQGLLVYFNEEELQDYVILDPQWIIDAFKCIITSWQVFSKKPNLREMWQEFQNTAILKHNLIEEVWKRNDKTDFLADRELLLKYLVRLGIMSRGRAYDEDTGKVEELDYFLVPSFLPVLKDESDIETLLIKAKPTQMVIVFKFEHSYISPTIYHRTTAAALSKWLVVERRGTQLLYGNIGMYRLPRHHVGLVRLTDKTLELSMHNLCGKRVNSDIADGFRRFITRAIKNELNRFHCGRETQITTAFRCSSCKQGTENEHVTIEELKDDDSLPCRVTLSGHIINGKRAYREWFVAADTFVQIDSQVLQKKLGDREIGQITKAIGPDWKLLGTSLGISFTELDQIQADYHYSSALQILHMLQKWKERAAREATMQALYDKMKDMPEGSIDWDRIKYVIDSLC